MTIAVIMSHIVLYYIFIFYECCVKVLLCYTDIIDHEISQKKDSVLMTAQFSNYVSKSRTVQHCFEFECKPNGSETRLE